VVVPKVSDDHKRRRHEQILEAAQRCFAQYGYEGATVARLEQATGLSRGAIFNYFPDKEALFLAVAVRSSERMTSIWLEHGFRALLDALVNEDPDWLAVQLESIRRVRTDEKFQRLVEEHERRVAEGRPDRLEQLRSQGVRDDVAIESIAIFLSCIANGLALRHTMADPPPDLDEIAELVDHGVRGGATRKQRGEWKQTTSRTRRTRPSQRRSSAA
jgi:TetR/AcrR family transcriptional regulator, transcriptional repressor of aconitase